VNTPRAGIGIISNPRSGHNRDRFAVLRQQLDSCPDAMHRVTEDPGAIAGVLAEFAAANVELLVINGGDGTASAVLAEVIEGQHFRQPPPVALLPAGTANMNAGDVGVRGSLPQALRRLTRWAQRPDRYAQRVVRRLLRVSVDGAETRAYGMFLGAGAVVHGTEYAHREIHARGLRDDFSLALGTARTAWGVMRGEAEFTRPTRVAVTLDERELGSFDTLILALSTLERLAFGMRPFWGGGDGPLRLTLIEQQPRRFLPTFFSILRGRPGRHARPGAGYHSHRAGTLRLGLTGDINLDGELLAVNRQIEVEASAPIVFLRP
jgi:diacylglycerol kinase family enzyme